MNVSLASRVSRFAVVASIGLASFAAACSGGDGGSNTPATSADAGVLPGKGTTTSPTPGKDTPQGAKDAGAKPPPTGAGTTCGALVACIGNCGEDDEACDARCADEASPEAITQIQTLATCIQGSGCEDVECARTACADEFAGCDGLE